MEKTRQYIFTYGSADDKQQLIAILQSKGYTGSGVTLAEPAGNHVHALCADVKSRTFYYINATCAAGWSQAGRPFYTAADCETVLPAVAE